MTRKLIFALVLIVLMALCAFAQTPTQTPPNSPSLETILSEAEKQTQNYHETFKNLLADERKTFESYNKNGEVKDQTVVESTFLVYQSSKARSNVLSFQISAR